MENIVYNELLVRGYNVDVGIVDVFAKNSEGKRVHKQLEVDFVVNQGSQRYYIQVAYDMISEEKQMQELNSFRNIPDSFKKIVIVNGTKKPWRNEEGFVFIGMKYFLLNADSLEFQYGKLDDLFRYVKRSKAMVEQIDELHQKIEQLKSELPTEDNSAGKFETQLENIINMESFDREKIQKVIKKVIINGEDNIEIVWNTDDPFFR